ncbi:carbohydrate ABC transporter permease [Paenibacillus alginolyticus]|uniref:Carbohydrate ABC transporter permease n=1 Tax=Paenibacillus alginolyticus TaxID=59839 RepID=A0ABT4GL93_9BACL|nr:carbohydrate ABC transporter permease [Paenibacillus alginolyticus]MCY9667275.1 carbohydrate ABC transporter permease [Paenibacillus alginolyticus]MCY9696876.1 carbohydrate ABC transporter permease [Paenibacillus alginolyticus]MEC0142034.1 carbohydrate ABC transporter permease [Paenibacillus alginolyticus]
MLIVGIVTLYPFLNVLAISFNDATDSVRGGIYIWPRVLTIQNYKEIFQYHNLLVAARNSVLRSVIGTGMGVFSAAMVAYVLSRKDFIARKIFSLMFVLTLYVSGGLIPVYMLMRDLHLTKSFWVYILPSLVNAWNIFVIRSYIEGLPVSLQESAKIDGANDATIFFKIILPLCKPVLATIALFVAVGQWNSWFDTFLYNSNSDYLSTLQYELMKILANTNAGSSSQDIFRTGNAEQATRVSPESIRMAITIVAAAPIVIVYPFLQKYFVKGLTLGAVKS